jgi:hypothetical protein
MRKILSTGLLMIISLSSCNKNVIIPTQGIITINNITAQSQTYYVYGFLFSEAKLVTTLDNPDPDITVDSDGTYLYLQTTSLNNSFFRFGEYDDETTAIEAFKGLKSITNPQWAEWADKAGPNQIWIFRSGTDHYAKIRIISTVAEVRDGRNYAECKFEWVYQPDGSLTFPGK